MPICMICDQTCSNSFSLNRHLRTVHGSEHHQCRDCSKTYARYDTLKKHRRIRHQEIYETQTHQLIPVLTPESPEKRNETILSTSNHLLASPLTAPVQQGHSPRLASMNFDSTIQHSQNLGTAVEYLESGQQILIAPSFDANEEARAAEAWYDHVHDDLPSVASYNASLLLVPDASREDHENSGALDAMLDMDADTDSQPPMPPFLVNAFQKLRQKYPNAHLTGAMQFRPFSFTGFSTTLHSAGTLDSNHIPIIQCLDCPSKDCFTISPSSDIGLIKKHLDTPEHSLVRSNRRHEAYLATRQGCARPSMRRNLAPLGKQKLLIHAVMTKNIDRLTGLLDGGYRVEEKGDMQRTALHWACELGYQDMAELLVRHGASLDNHDGRVETPLDLLLKSDVSMAIRLVQVLAEVKFEDSLAVVGLDESLKAYQTAIVLACRFNRLAIVEGLVDAGSDVNERTMNSPLAIAIRYASWEVVQYLLSKGAAVQSIGLFDLREVNKKMVGARVGSEYQDAVEKITLLRQYGLNFEGMVNVPLDPCRLGFRRLGDL